MKRSEVLQRLSMLIDSTENITAPNSSYYDAEGLAEEILCFIERIGMLPPERLINQQVGCVMYVNTPSNSWEEE